MREGHLHNQIATFARHRIGRLSVNRLVRSCWQPLIQRVCTLEPSASTRFAASLSTPHQLPRHQARGRGQLKAPLADAGADSAGAGCAVMVTVTVAVDVGVAPPHPDSAMTPTERPAAAITPRMVRIPVSAVQSRPENDGGSMP